MVKHATMRVFESGNGAFLSIQADGAAPARAAAAGLSRFLAGKKEVCFARTCAGDTARRRPGESQQRPVPRRAEPPAQRGLVSQGGVEDIGVRIGPADNLDAGRNTG